MATPLRAAVATPAMMPMIAVQLKPEVGEGFDRLLEDIEEEVFCGEKFVEIGVVSELKVGSTSGAEDGVTEFTELVVVVKLEGEGTGSTLEGKCPACSAIE